MSDEGQLDSVHICMLPVSLLMLIHWEQHPIPASRHIPRQNQNGRVLMLICQVHHQDFSALMYDGSLEAQKECSMDSHGQRGTSGEFSFAGLYPVR